MNTGDDTLTGDHIVYTAVTAPGVNVLTITKSQGTINMPVAVVTEGDAHAHLHSLNFVSKQATTNIDHFSNSY